MRKVFTASEVPEHLRSYFTTLEETGRVQVARHMHPT